MRINRTMGQPIHRTIRTAVAVLAVAALPATVVAVPAIARPASPAADAAVAKCPTGWGSLPEASTYRGPGTLTDVRAGRHACFDRIVFDVQGKPSWSRVEYVANVHTPGEGKLVPLRGTAKLRVVLSVPAHDNAGRATYNPPNRKELVNVAGYRTFRQAALAGSFEGETTVGLGVRARLPFRVFTIASSSTTSRVVVDVAHSW